MVGEAARLISADSHIFEPLDLWQRALGERFGESTPRPLSEHKGKKGRFFHTGRRVAAVADADAEHRDAGHHRAGYEPEPRLRYQAEAGIAAELIYPTYMLLVMHNTNVACLKAAAEVYNDWLADYVSADPVRLIGVGVAPLVDVDWATTELERCARRGFKGVMVNCREPQGCPPYRDPSYDAFWARVCEMDLPVTLHSLTGWAPGGFQSQTDDAIGNAPGASLDVSYEIQLTMANDFVFGRIFDRFPDLKIVCSEFEFSWVPFFMWRLEQIQIAFAKRLNLAKLDLERAGDYVRTRVWHGWIDDGYGARVAHDVGIDRILWGSDFPHVRSVGLEARTAVAKMLDGLTADEQRKILGENTAGLYAL